MSRYKLQVYPQAQITIGTTATLLSTLLGLSTDAECLISDVVIQSDPTNTGTLYVGGVDASGVADVTATKCLVVTSGNAVGFCADDKMGDGDRIVYDLRQMSLKFSAAGGLVNVALVKPTDSSANN